MPVLGEVMNKYSKGFLVKLRPYNFPVLYDFTDIGVPFYGNSKSELYSDISRNIGSIISIEELVKVK